MMYVVSEFSESHSESPPFESVVRSSSCMPLPSRLQSAYPIAISVRASNVYEEKAVGVQETEEDDEEFETEARPSSYILHHVRRQLAFDIWYLCTGIFILCIIERHRIESGDWR